MEDTPHNLWVISHTVHLRILNDNIPHLQSLFPLWLFYYYHSDLYLSYNSTDNCILYYQNTFVSFAAQDCFYDLKQLATTDFTVARKRRKNLILDNQVQFSKLLASFRWLFGPTSAWGSIEKTTIGKTHPTLYLAKNNKTAPNIGFRAKAYIRMDLESIKNWPLDSLLFSHMLIEGKRKKANAWWVQNGHFWSKLGDFR